MDLIQAILGGKNRKVQRGRCCSSLSERRKVFCVGSIEKTNRGRTYHQGRFGQKHILCSCGQQMIFVQNEDSLDESRHEWTKNDLRIGKMLILLKIILITVGVAFTTFGYEIYFQKKHNLINGFEEDYKAGRKTERFLLLESVSQIFWHLSLNNVDKRKIKSQHQLT